MVDFLSVFVTPSCERWVELDLRRIKLEHAMLIVPHANGEPLLKRSSSHSHSFPAHNDSACCWSANGSYSALTSKASSKVNLLYDNTSFACSPNYVIL